MSSLLVAMFLTGHIRLKRLRYFVEGDLVLLFQILIIISKMFPALNHNSTKHTNSVSLGGAYICTVYNYTYILHLYL